MRNHGGGGEQFKSRSDPKSPSLGLIIIQYHCMSAKYSAENKTETLILAKYSVENETEALISAIISVN